MELKINYGNISSNKTKGIIFGIVAAIFGIFTLLAFIDSEILIAIILGIITLSCLAISIEKIESAKNANKYINFLKSDLTIIKEIAERLGIEEDTVKNEIETLIKEKILCDVYIDQVEGEVKNFYSRKNKVTSKLKNNEVITEITCPGCGANILSTDSECEFCGRHLK